MPAKTSQMLTFTSNTLMSSSSSDTWGGQQSYKTKGLLAVAIESGRVVWWVTFPCAGHHHDHNLLLGLDQAIHTQLIE